MTPAITKPRSHYLDTLKVGAIFLVCFYHAALLDLDVIAHHTAPVYAHFFLEAFASVAIPLFFMVNGALLLNRDLNLRRHLGKTVSLYFLIFIWGAITLYGQAIIRGEHYSPSGFVWALWELKPGRINHLWFLNAIVMIYLLLPILKEIYDSRRKAVLGWMLAMLFVFSFGNLFLNWLVNMARFLFDVQGFDLAKQDAFDFFKRINPFGGYFYAIFYFVIGGCLGKAVQEDRPRIASHRLVALLLLSWIALFSYGLMRSEQTGILYDPVWNGYYSIPTLLMAVSLFVLASRLRHENNRVNAWLTIVGANTLGIYLLHPVLIPLFEPHYRGLSIASDIFANLVYVLAILLLSLGMAIVIGKTPAIRRLLTL